MKRMKRMKTLFALLLAVMLCASMVLPAYAEEGGPTGTITVYNAEHGQTYHVVPVFTAKVSEVIVDGKTTQNVTYYLDKDAHPDLYNLINENTPVEVDGTTIQNPFSLLEGDDGLLEVIHKTPGEGQSAEFGRGWLYNHYLKGHWSAEEAAYGELADADMDVLTFDAALPYGYYMIYKTDSNDTKSAMASVVTVSRATNSIADKNPRTPGDPDKKVKLDPNGSYSSSNTEAQLGDTLYYQASFMATNYRNLPDMTTQKITQYTIRDEAKGLKYSVLRSIRFYKTKNADGTFSDELTDYAQTWSGEGEDVAPYKPDTAYGGYSMELPWVDASGNHIYPSPVYVVMEYEGYMNDAALNILNNNTTHNTFTPMFRVENTTTDIPLEDPPSVDVFTSGLTIKKTDGKGTFLSGVEFILSKVEGTGTTATETYYHVNTESSTVTGETWKNIEWVNKDDADKVTQVNNSDVQSFGGLKSGTYRLYETKAPEGYKHPSFDYWEIKISSPDEDGNFTAKIRAEGSENWTDLPNAVTSSQKTTRYFQVDIVNEGGTPLPSTGAAGTTMLLLVGGTMFAVTMLFLVTKKRLYNEG